MNQFDLSNFAYEEYLPNCLSSTEKELSRFTGTCKREGPLLSDQENRAFDDLVQVGEEVLYSSDIQSLETPTSVDWREKGLIGPVLDQGYCSSSWAYAAITALETAYALKTKHFVRFAKQRKNKI